MSTPSIDLRGGTISVFFLRQPPGDRDVRYGTLLLDGGLQILLGIQTRQMKPHNKRDVGRNRGFQAREKFSMSAMKTVGHIF